MPTREHCLAVKELYCHKEWLTLEGSTAGTTAPSSLLPACQALPSLHSDPDACTHVPLVGESFNWKMHRLVNPPEGVHVHVFKIVKNSRGLCVAADVQQRVQVEWDRIEEEEEAP